MGIISSRGKLGTRQSAHACSWFHAARQGAMRDLPGMER